MSTQVYIRKRLLKDGASQNRQKTLRCPIFRQPFLVMAPTDKGEIQMDSLSGFVDQEIEEYNKHLEK